MLTLADLPALNATLNGISAILLVIAFIFIKRKNITAHRRTMLAAFATSALFLTSYLIYHANIGSKPYPGTGVMRTVYFSILIPHVILAAVVLPLALITLSRGLRMEVQQHRKIARVTLPLWLFVSVTGVIVYLMLYGA
jgi:putative membrane protein